MHFDPDAFGAAMGDLILEAVAPLKERIAELERQLADRPDVKSVVAEEVAAAVADIPKPADGKSVTVEDVRPMVEEIVRGTCAETAKRALEELPQLVRDYMADNPPPAGPRGEKGDPGADAPAVDVDALREEITRTVRDDLSAEARDELPQLVRAYLSENPPAAGPKGDPGPKGEDGAGVADLLIDRDGTLVATFTDGRMKHLGVVVGRDGKDGKDGIDGKDGVGLDAFEIEYLPETHEVRMVAEAAGRKKELRYPAGGIRPAGYWRSGSKAKAAEAWVHKGSLWIARADTTADPDPKSGDWILAARHGRDGERGPKGADGAPPSPIKLG